MTKSKTSKSKGGKSSRNGRGSNSWKKQNGPRKEFVKIEFTRHIPVLLQSVLEQLDLKKGLEEGLEKGAKIEGGAKGQIFVDCNVGDGGHSE